MSYLNPKKSYLEEDLFLEKISQAFFATLLDEDIETETTNQKIEGVLGGVPGAWFLSLKRLLGLPHFTHEKEVNYYQAEFATATTRKPFELDWGFILGCVNYVFLGGFIIEPLKALWKVAFEFPLRALEVTIFHIRCYLNPNGMMNKLLYGIEQLFVLPRVLSRAIFRPLKSYYLIGTDLEDSPKLKKAAQITSAVISITAAVAVCVVLPFFIHVAVPHVASLVGHISPQIAQGITWLGTGLGSALTIAVATVQATFNSIIPMTAMLSKRNMKRFIPRSDQSATELLSAEESANAHAASSRPRLHPSPTISLRVNPGTPVKVELGAESRLRISQAQRDRISAAALPGQSVSSMRRSRVVADEGIQADTLTGSLVK